MESKSFEELGLTKPLLSQLVKLGYEVPTPIQQACIPLLLHHRDVLGLAQTGTGKTAAFSLPIIQNLVLSEGKAKSQQVRSLILSPTRELALQIYHNVVAYAKSYGLSVGVIYGGVGYANQFKMLAQGVDILVATPGRLIDHLERKTVNLKKVAAFVLDEADHMLDMGFAPALKKIMVELPRERHTMLFSATMPDSILSLAQQMLVNPETVMITPPSQTADRVEQYLYYVPTQPDKRDVVLALLRQEASLGKVLIFSRTKHGANKLAKFLSGHGFPANAIHGDKGQNLRERLLREFKSGESPILVATDIAARGIDVKGIDLVINYDLPMEPESYIHRIGRTARAGAEGVAVSLCCADEAKSYVGIRRLLKQDIPMHPDSVDLPAEMCRMPRRGTGRRSAQSLGNGGSRDKNLTKRSSPRGERSLRSERKSKPKSDSSKSAGVRSFGRRDDDRRNRSGRVEAKGRRGDRY